MTRKARIWTGGTLAAILALNYAVLAVPLFKKSASIRDKSRSMLMRQANSRDVFRDSGDEYVFEMYRKEKAAIDGNIFFVNVISFSFFIAIASWTIFGALFHKERR